jgi:hypothetical protein
MEATELGPSEKEQSIGQNCLQVLEQLSEKLRIFDVDSNKETLELNAKNNPWGWLGTYEGEMQEGLPHGIGSMQWTGGYLEGTCHSGEWVKGKRHGLGTCSMVLMDKQQGVYQGGWCENKQHGYGAMDFTNGTKYTGEWVNGVREGEGIFSYADGCKYVGQFTDNTKHGYGVYHMNSGRRYEGDWVKNKQTGKGAFFFAEKVGLLAYNLAYNTELTYIFDCRAG